MTYQRLAYDDQDSATQMHSDCDACASAMSFPRQLDVTGALEEAPAIAFESFAQDLPKPVITVSDAAAHLASRLHLHLD